MKEYNIEKSAYSQIVELCYQHGVISSRNMTEKELWVVLDSLCAFLAISCPEQAASGSLRFEIENQK